jgi:hypothetical protein
MRKLFVVPVAVALATVEMVPVQEIAHAQVPANSQAQKSARKTVVAGGDNMGTYIEAVQANFGKPNVTVTLPTLENNKK